MSSSIGNVLKITIFGESHGPAIGMVIDGFPAGVKVDYGNIKTKLYLRHSSNDFSTPRNEPDQVEFLSGVFNDYTTGSPISFIIRNKDVDSSSYVKGNIRPSHADLTNYLKSNGFNDYRGGGFSSGRITASLVVLGSLCEQILSVHGIKIFSHISSIRNISDDKFDLSKVNDLSIDNFPVINQSKKELMIKEILKAKESGDSVGGTVETAIIGAPFGLGEPYFNSVESFFSQLLFSIGGVKGVSFGEGESFTQKLGSEVSDELYYVEDEIVYRSNHNGGINGGITNGQPILLKTFIKPTASISKEQDSINVESKENIKLKINGKHDPCIVHRVLPVINAVLSYAILDLLMIKESKNI